MIKNKKNLKTKKARENALPVIAKYEQEIKDSEENIKDLSYRLDKIKEEIKKAKEKLFPMQAGDVPITFADIDDLIADTGFKPATTIEDGIEAFVEWYKLYYAK